MLDILVILDRSGSMQDAKADHEGGLRSFVEDQRQIEGDVRFTFVRFDTHQPCEIVYDRVTLDQVTKIELVPRGGTPLLDAIGKALAHLEAKRTPAEGDQVVCLIVTDGEENESREWTKERVRARVTELEAKGWTFLFLGANVDAFHEAAAVGVGHGTTMDYDNSPVGVAQAYAATSSNLRGARAYACASPGDLKGFSENLNYTAQQRTSAKGQTTNGPVSGSSAPAPDEKAEG